MNVCMHVGWEDAPSEQQSAGQNSLSSTLSVSRVSTLARGR